MNQTHEGLEKSKEQAAKSAFGDSFLAKSVDLVGRQGMAYEGE